MTINRFEEINQYIHFNDSSQEPPRGADNYDRLFKVGPILDNILEKIQNIFEPSKNLSIDEGMIAFKGRLSFRQYMPAKPTKSLVAADSSNGYVSNFSVYLGQEGNEHRIHGLGYDVVMKMATPFLNKNWHIFFDNFFRVLSSLIVFLLRPLMHVEQFAATGKTYRRVQNKSSSKER